MADLISLRTRKAFRDYFSGVVLREIEELFDDAGIDFDREFEPPPRVSGARRRFVEQHYATLDFSSPPDVRKVLQVYEQVLRSLEDLVGAPWGERATAHFHRLTRALESDGFVYEAGKRARHMMRRFWTLAAGRWRFVGLAFVACSCGPDADNASTLSDTARHYASSLCEAEKACGCAARFTDQAACEETFATRFDQATSRLTLDDSCFDMVLAAPLDMCVSDDAWPSSLECDAFVGTKIEGEDCSPSIGLPLLRVNECDGDLICVGGKCMPSGAPAVKKAAGEACVHETPGSCGDVELFCAEDDRCHTRGIAGEACESPYECFDPTFAASLYCAGVTGPSGICAAQVSIGGACDPLDYLPCLTIVDGETTTYSHCDPTSKTCVEGRAGAVCAALDVPQAWP